MDFDKYNDRTQRSDLLAAGDTIAAIATSQAPGGIGIIRISGPTAIIIAQTLFRRNICPIWSQLRGYNVLYGSLEEPGLAPDAINIVTNDVIDECICLIFRAPKSYTGEDVVEFQCHGGPVVLRRALEAVFAAGARPAEPGEFTRRAYLNGRLDLAKAEAVMQLIAAGSEQAARAAQAAMGGALSARIEAVRARLLTLTAHISAWVDYPEEDIPSLQASEMAATLRAAAADLDSLLAHARRDQLMLGGITTALLGKPNVGKSSLMNLLAGYDRSIVTDLPGTTRDTITETVQLGALTLRLIDTAGLRDTAEAIERAGVERSRAALRQADLLLAVCDASAPLAREDFALLDACDPARTILIRNKRDLGAAWPVPPAFPHAVDMSALTGQGVEDLALAAARVTDAASFSPCEAILANRRQTDCARAAHEAITEALQAQQAGYPLDAISVCLEDAIQALYALTGERVTDAVVDEVFSKFCVGK